MKKKKGKEYYFFVAYQVWSRGGILMLTGDSFEGIETNVDDGEYEHFGLKELKEKLLKRAMEANPCIKEDSNVLITSLSELSKDFWYQMNPLERDEDEK
jgi:hypothetical protein